MRDEPAQELGRCASRRLLVQFRKCELAHPIDGDEQVQLALVRPDLREIDVDVPERIGLELLARPRPLRLGQTADVVPLEEAMERRSRQMRSLAGHTAIVEGQQCVSTKRDDQRFLVWQSAPSSAGPAAPSDDPQDSCASAISPRSSG
jgi:hypothetical protein